MIPSLLLHDLHDSVSQVAIQSFSSRSLLLKLRSPSLARVRSEQELQIRAEERFRGLWIRTSEQRPPLVCVTDYRRRRCHCLR